MSVVIDSSALIALAVIEPNAQAIAERLRQWDQAGEDLHAPILARYEIASAMTKKVIRNEITREKARAAQAEIFDLAVKLHPPADNDAIVDIALALERSSAYDASYIALAEQLGAELWTTDGPLKRNAISRGYPVKLFEDQ